MSLFQRVVWLSVLAGSVTLSSVSVGYAQRPEVGPKGPAFSAEQLKKPQVVFAPTQRDPMLSADDTLLLKHREQQRAAQEAVEARRRAEDERKRKEEERKKREWELAVLKDPSLLIRDKIHINGLIDKEVLIGGKLYSIGNTYMGAKIVDVSGDSVTFVYRGARFTKKVKL